jgi:hypothetical protein
MTHKAESTAALFDMTKRYYENTPDALRPSTKYSSKRELKFDKLDSGYMVATAGGEAVARGETLTLAHLSELAFWPKSNAKALLSGILDAIPNTKGTAVFIESTANGVSGEFYDFWKKAEAGENGYIPIFLPWFIQDEYREPVPEGFERTPTEEDWPTVSTWTTNSSCSAASRWPKRAWSCSSRSIRQQPTKRS